MSQIESIARKIPLVPLVRDKNPLCGSTGIRVKDRTVATVHHAHVNCSYHFQGLDLSAPCATICQ